MTEMSSATALRKLEQAKAGLRNSRKALKMLRTVSAPSDTIKSGVFAEGWTSLALAQRLMGEIPADAASEDVMTRQLAVQRYATSLLVRLRRLARNDFRSDDLDHEDDDELDSE